MCLQGDQNGGESTAKMTEIKAHVVTCKLPELDRAGMFFAQFKMPQIIHGGWGHFTYGIMNNAHTWQRFNSGLSHDDQASPCLG